MGLYYGGTEVKHIYYGSTEIKRVYYGATQVYQTAAEAADEDADNGETNTNADGG